MKAPRWSEGVVVSGEKPFRGVFARRPLKRGEIILQEAPVLTLLSPQQWSVRCNGCFSKPTNKLLRCSRCQTFWYCSKACQRKDWKVHKEECAWLGQHHSSTDPQNLAEALLVARVLRLKTTAPQQFRRIEDLVFHEPQDHHKEIAKLVRTLLLDDDTDTTTDTTILELLARFDANNFGIVDELLFFLGAGIFPAGARLNHSCHANCAIFYEANTHTQIIRCLVDVAPGEELCHSYIDLACTSTQRRDKLRQRTGLTVTANDAGMKRASGNKPMTGSPLLSTGKLLVPLCWKRPNCCSKKPPARTISKWNCT